MFERSDRLPVTKHHLEIPGMKKERAANALIRESSPYLLQHAHNPVNWLPWGDVALEAARRQNKLLLVSIGYAACHWCHVMERECFEDEQVAVVMNEWYVCVKVDREERPDVDHFFMTAVQLTGVQGGWPLNCIALPDGRPVWGGTYFPKESWIEVLLEVNRIFSANSAQVLRHAENLAHGIRQASLPVNPTPHLPVNPALIDRAVEDWKLSFDTRHGGRKGHPKFPMPVSLQFLLHYGVLRNDAQISGQVKLTLEKMAMGGIYDQAGGGFARYSVDEYWKVPHFEKMLYDNAQLLSVYAQACQVWHSALFRSVVEETVGFLEREMLHPSGAFFSSLDADSEGEEGRFYVWQKEELAETLGGDFELFGDCFNVNETGCWEAGNYILMRSEPDEAFAQKHNLPLPVLAAKIARWKSLLQARRSLRVRPALDDKILTSWNALVISGLCEAFRAIGEPRFRELAIRNALFLHQQVIASDGTIFHTWKAGKASVTGFLEDYALTARAFLALFEVTGEEEWAFRALHLTENAIKKFWEEEAGLFYFSEKGNNTVITNHFQLDDNVLPASNSVMAQNLFRLYLLFGKPGYLQKVHRMLQAAGHLFAAYPTAYANWGSVMLNLTEPFFEVAVCGENALKLVAGMQRSYLPQLLWAPAQNKSRLPLLENRLVKGKTLIYTCREGICQLPVETAAEAMAQVQVSQ